MKVYLFFIVSFLTLNVFCQYENTSFFFGKENLDSIKSFEGFDDKIQGYYDQESVKYKQMILTKDSISVRFGSEIIISKKEALAKGYTFKDQKMYGIAPLNGVYYQEFNDTILALYYQYDNYFSSNIEDFVLTLKEGYLLFFQESNGFYSVEYLQVKDKKMEIYSMDHTLMMDTLLKLSSIYKEEKNGITTYVASPSEEELTRLVETECFNQLRDYKLNKDL